MTLLPRPLSSCGCSRAHQYTTAVTMDRGSPGFHNGLRWALGQDLISDNIFPSTCFRKSSN